MKLLACFATLLVAVLFGWLIERVVGRVPRPDADTEMRLAAELKATAEMRGLAWMPCHAPTCAHLETTHRRVHATELWQCTGCGNTRTAPEGARRG